MRFDASIVVILRRAKRGTVGERHSVRYAVGAVPTTEVVPVIRLRRRNE